MLRDIVAVEPRDDYHLWLRFDDGAEGVVALAQTMEFRGVFALLKDPLYFQQARLNPELGTVEWPNGADLDPDVLYSLATGSAMPEERLARETG